jgi:ATP-binding cassette subfamily F protein uup
VETLELLEELLMDYKGTLLLVSHDRDFINNVVTSTLVFEGDGQVNEYVGGYDDWLHQRSRQTEQKKTVQKPTPQKQEPRQAESKPKKLSYKDQRELEQLPKRIEALETELDQLQNMMASPTFYQQDGAEIAAARSQLEKLEQELAECFQRWEELEA